MELLPNRRLEEVDVIRVGMPVDNLSVDQAGDIYAASFPQILKVVKSFQDPYRIGFTSTIWRIRRSGSSYEVKKVLEDREAKVLGGATVAVHDTVTGRLFAGGIVHQTLKPSHG